MVKGKTKFLEVLKTISQHPAIAGLSVMVVTTLVQSGISDEARGKNAHLAKIDNQMRGLYNGAQTITLAAMTIPVAIKGLELGTEVFKTVAAKKAAK